MIGIEAIGTYLPKGRVSNLERCAQFDCDENFVNEKLGFREVAVASDEEGAFELAVAAVDDLKRRSGLDLGVVDMLVVVTQTPGENIPHVSARLHGHLGLSTKCACFDISLGCSGYVYALAILRSVMEDQGYRSGLLLTSDPYSKIVKVGDRDTAMVFGDGATATLLSRDPRYVIGRTTMKTLGEASTALATHEGHLRMNGRAIFTFSAQQVPGDIMEALELNGLALDQVDLFVIHQGSRFLVETIRGRLKLPPQKVPFHAIHYGNTVSSSIPMILADVLSDAVAPERIVISGFGVGLSMASTVLTKSGGTRPAGGMTP
jgi:3-oxoacyl-[acyl-carrier-protein] synthase-3